jgi:hypothetical protein
MRKSSQRGLRAYVCTFDSGVDEMAGYPNFHTTSIKNVGQTPAYDVTGRLEWRCLAGTDAHWPPQKQFEFDAETEATRGSASVVGSQQVLELRYDLERSKDGTSFQDAYARIERGEVAIFIYGVIYYRDIYRKQHFTKWCDVLRKTPQGVVHMAYDRHNEAN